MALTAKEEAELTDRLGAACRRSDLLVRRRACQIWINDWSYFPLRSIRHASFADFQASEMSPGPSPHSP